jgi:hypothetical protein
LAEYNIYDSYRGLPSFSEDSSVQLVTTITRRKREFAEMLRLGRPVIIFTSPPQICYIDTGQREYSGTGRNRAVTRIVDRFDLLRAVPLQISPVDATGSKLRFQGDAAFRRFCERNADEFFYWAYLENPPQDALPFAYIEGTDKIVGMYVARENGSLIFLPQRLPEEAEDYEQDEEAEGDEEPAAADDSKEPIDEVGIDNSSFADSLIELLNELKDRVGDFELPSWTTGYMLPQEETAQDTIRDLEKRRAAVESEIASNREALAKLERRKLLFSGSGRSLEVLVREVFEALGCEVSEPPLGRDDLIINCDGSPAVVEVKGVAGSAAERHAAQLEKWVSAYFETHNTQPKGILVVNAFREQPLPERIETVFPDQMLGYCKQRGHCLITGLQLLGILLEVERNPSAAEELRRSLFETIGRYERYRDRREFVVEAPTKCFILEVPG